MISWSLGTSSSAKDKKKTFLSSYSCEIKPFEMYCMLLLQKLFRTVTKTNIYFQFHLNKTHKEQVGR